MIVFAIEVLVQSSTYEINRTNQARNSENNRKAKFDRNLIVKSTSNTKN